MIFYIYGTDAYLCREKLEEIKKGFVQKKDKAGLNVISLNSENINLDSFSQEALTVPFLSEKKLIVINNLCADNRAGQKKIRDEIFNFLKERGDKLDNNLLFIDVFEDEKKLPQKDQLFNLLKKQPYAWQLLALKNNQLSAWIKKFAAKNEFDISPSAVSELVTLVGNDLLQTTNELAKLKAYKNDATIEAEDVKNLVKAKYDNDIFRLTDALANQDRKLSLKLIADQLNSGNESLSLLGSINWQFKTLLKIKSSLEANPKITPAQISNETGIHSYVVSKNLSAVKKFTLAELIDSQNQLLEMEKELKSGHKNPELLLDLFIAKNS